MPRITALVVLLVGVAGCAPFIPFHKVKVTAVPLGSQEYEPRARDYPIVVYETEGDIPHEWVKVGRISARKSGGFGVPSMTQVGEFIERFKKRAREMGADAIILREGFSAETDVSTTGPGGGGRAAVRTTSGPDLGGWFGHTVLAIRYTSSTPK